MFRNLILAKVHWGCILMHAFLSYPLLFYPFTFIIQAFWSRISNVTVTTLSTSFYSAPVTRTRSISAANTANLLNRNAWRPNCFSFEALRPSPRSQMGPCPPPFPLHFLLFATRVILRSIPFSTTRKMRECDAPVFFYLSFFSFRIVWRAILCIVNA